MNLKQNIIMTKGLKLLTLTVVFLTLPFFQVGLVFADDLTISSNGDSSNNTVNVSALSTQTIDQSNSGSVSNNAAPQTNTGDNKADSNTGGSDAIQTGAATTNLSIKNDLNSSTVNNSCCPQPGGSSVAIENNGSSSNNTASLNAPSSTNVSVTQNAQINNSVHGSVNTGQNSASGNNGDVSITTGNIIAKQKIVNENINSADVTVPQGGGNISVKIEDNGQNSINIVSVDDAISHNVVLLNAVSLRNVLDLYASSGDNKADSNLGTVSITTGDVLIDTFVKNADINFSKVVFNCCNATTNNPPPPPGPPGPPAPPSTGGGSNDNPSNTTTTTTTSSGASTTTTGQGGGPGILGASIMPATGSNLLLWLSLLSALMFALGLYLRFHPGQDPGKNLAWIILYQSWLT